MLLKCIIISLIAFCLGSIMFSYFIPKIFLNVDIRKVKGSDGNPGSSNAIKACGKPIGFSCMVLDIFKALLPVFLAWTTFKVNDYYLIPIMIAPILGHAYSPFLKFRGGKSIGCAFGVLLAVLPITRIVVLMALSMALFKFIIVIKPDSTLVFVSYVVSIIVALIFEPLPFIKIAYAILGLIIISRVVSNPDKGEIVIGIGKLNIPIGDHIFYFKK